MQRRVILLVGKTGQGKTTLAKTLRRSFSRTLTVDPLAQFDGTIFYDFDSLADYVAARINSDFDAVLRAEDILDVQYLFRLAWSVQRVCVVVEESDLYINPRSIDDDFFRLVSWGRHRQISIIAVARRVPELPISLRAQFSTIITFAQTEQRDIDILSDYGFDPDRVRSLSRYEYEVVGEAIDQTAPG